MIVWHSMTADPPGREEYGKLLLLTVLPRYGEPYVDAIRWFGLSSRVWPKITHWAYMPLPAICRDNDYEANQGR